MKKIMIMVLITLLTLVGCSSENSGNALKIGVIQYSNHVALDKSYEGFKAALAENGYVDGENIVINYSNAQSDSATNETIAEKLVNDQSDLIYAIATPSAQAVANKTEDIPIVVAAVTDPQASGLVESNEKPGGNITGVSDLTAVVEQIELLLELVPEVNNVAVMYASSEDNSRLQAEMAISALKEKGIAYTEATVSDINDIQQVSQSLVNKVDAIYIPTDNLLAEGITTVTSITVEQGIPTIVGEKGMTEGGGLASDAIDYYNLGYMAGLQAIEILSGTNTPSTMPVKYLDENNREIVINTDVAEQLNIEIPESLKSKATLVKWKSN